MKALKDQEVERVVFNAITKQSVTDAMKNPRKIDAALVDAYLARRALDYLVGFTLSPVLWRKLPGARSAWPRATRLRCGLFVTASLRSKNSSPREFWSIVATLATPRGDTFEARLVGADGKKIQRLDIGTGVEANDPEKCTRKRCLQRSQLWESKPGKRHPLRAVHHIDVAAGSQPQARFRTGAYDADRAAAIRRRGHRR